MLKIISKIIDLFNQEKDRRSFYVNERKGRSFEEVYKTLTFEEKENILYGQMPVKGKDLPIKFVDQDREGTTAAIDYYFIVDCISYKMSFIVVKDSGKIVFIEQIVEEVYCGDAPPSVLDFV